MANWYRNQFHFNLFIDFPNPKTKLNELKIFIIYWITANSNRSLSIHLGKMHIHVSIAWTVSDVSDVKPSYQIFMNYYVFNIIMFGHIHYIEVASIINVDWDHANRLFDPHYQKILTDFFKLNKILFKIYAQFFFSSCHNNILFYFGVHHHYERFMWIQCTVGKCEEFNNLTIPKIVHWITIYDLIKISGMLLQHWI